MLFCRGSTDLVLICGKSHAVLRGTSPDYGRWPKWAYSSLDYRTLCLGHSVLPLPCENRRLSMGFCRDIFFVPLRSYRRSTWVSVLASNLLIQRAQHPAPPVGESFSPGSTNSSACSPTCRGIFPPGSTKSSACSPTCRGIFLSWYYRAQLAAPPKRQYVAPYSRMHRRLSPSIAAALTRHYRPLLRTR